MYHGCYSLHAPPLLFDIVVLVSARSLCCPWLTASNVASRFIRRTVSDTDRFTVVLAPVMNTTRLQDDNISRKSAADSSMASVKGQQPPKQQVVWDGRHDAGSCQ